MKISYCYINGKWLTKLFTGIQHFIHCHLRITKWLVTYIIELQLTRWWIIFGTLPNIRRIYPEFLSRYCPVLSYTSTNSVDTCRRVFTFVGTTFFPNKAYIWEFTASVLGRHKYIQTPTDAITECKRRQTTRVDITGFVYSCSWKVRKIFFMSGNRIF